MKIIIILILILLTTQPLQAKELEPDKKLPRWATEKCIMTISKIIQHETGAMKSDEVFRFMAEQIIDDIPWYGCDGLTRSRWKIGEHPEYKISRQVRWVVLDTLYDHPNKKYPNCQFIGYMGDIPIWKSYGYNTEIGYKKTIGRLTVIGVGCVSTRQRK